MNKSFGGYHSKLLLLSRFSLGVLLFYYFLCYSSVMPCLENGEKDWLLDVTAIE